MTRRGIGILCFAVYLCFGVCHSVCTAEVIDKIVAVVNNQTITSSEVEQAMKPIADDLARSYKGDQLQQKLSQARKAVIERLIDEKLILQEAKKQKIEVKNTEVEQRIREVKSKFPDEQSFQKAIAAQGVNMWELKKIYKEQIMVKKMVREYMRQHIQITPTAISDYYQKHLEGFRLPEAADISEILIKYKPNEESTRTEKTAMQVMELLNIGTDFATLARRYSEGPNAAGGGYLGLVERGAMAKEIDDVIFSLNEGEVSKPIKIDMGFLIVKLNYIRKERFKPIEEVKTKIEELLLDENAKNVIEKWVNDLKAAAFISVKE